MSNIDLLSRILDSLPVFIGLVDSEQRYEFVNASYVAKFNLPKDKIIGKTVRELNGETEYEKSREKIEAALRGENVEFEYQQADQWFRINYLPRWKRDRVTGYFVICADITQLKNTTFDLENSLQELRSTQSTFENFASFAHADRIASVGAMAIGLAHDISQPISSINILVDALRATIKDAEIETHALGLIAEIEQQVQFAADIINRLRRFSSNKDAERTKTNLNEVLKEALAMMKPRLLANEVDLQLNLAGFDTMAIVDGIEIQQVLVNLLANAIDSVSTMETTRTIRVVTGNDETNHFFCKIIDNGPGVPEEMTSKLFNAFESGKESGSGIGLAISHKLIQHNGGSLELERSQINEIGDTETIFVCKLPVVSNS